MTARAQQAVELRRAPSSARLEPATCPVCEVPTTNVIGRVSLRLVFRCDSCKVIFYRGLYRSGRP